MRRWVWHRICDETVGVTKDLWWCCGCDTGFVMRWWVWHRICDVAVGVTQDLWWDGWCDTGFVMRRWVWHRICDDAVGVTQDLWWDCGCDTGFVMRLWVLHRICDETVCVTQDLWWECGCDTGFVMRLWVWHRIQVQIKVSMNVSCFPQYLGWQWTVKSQIVHWLIVMLCASLGPGVTECLRHCATSREVPESIPSGVSGDIFHGSRRNHVTWGRLSLWKWVPEISRWVKAAGA